MADNTTLNSMTGGDVIASDDIAGVKFQRVKISHGADGSATDTSATDPLPIKTTQSATTIFTTTTPLAASASWNTGWIDTSLNGQNFVIACKTDKKGTVLHEESHDGATAATSHLLQVDVNENHNEEHMTHAKYSKFTLTNTDTAIQTSLIFQVIQYIQAQTTVQSYATQDKTTTVLGAGATYTTVVFNTKGRSCGLSMFGKASHAGTIYIDVSSDNFVTYDALHSHVYTAGEILHEMEIINAPYGRIRWLNGATLQTSFYFSVIQRIDPPAHTIKIDPLENTVTATGTKEHNTATPSTEAIEALTAVAKASAPTYGEGNMVAPRVTLSGDTAVTLDGETVTTTTVGTVAHGGSDAGNPLKIGGRADSTFQAAVTDGQRVDALFDVYGVQRVRNDQPNRWSYHENSSSALTDAVVQAAPGAGLSVYITDIVFSTGAATACNIFLEESTTTILGPYYLEAVAGRGLVTPLVTPHKCTANTAVTVTTSAAIAHGLDIKGFIAP